MEIFNHNSNVHFLGLRKFTISLAVLLIVASVAVLATRSLNYALDFTGGVSTEVSYDNPVAIEDVRVALDKGGIEHATVQSVGGTRRVLIRFQPKDDTHYTQQGTSLNLDAIAGDVAKALQAVRPDAKVASRSYVSAQVGEQLRSDGVTAAIFVIIGIGIYLWIRFERRFAIAALATELHDVLVTLGIVSLIHLEFDMTVLASVLAVIGYSINDKVVVFDRIRELFRSARKVDSEEILNRSINSTLSRTIITSLFTGIAMAALYFFGGPSVHGFAITMLIGILVGTLSSIFVACPILLWLGVSKKDLMPVTKENPELARRP
ncbi:protein translocase subunit SecF [Dyella mobilis]|uniref:Protein-export membrane protein SecF n=1 Tax=Dyella mobilis TaxID=1849582 RepID=A0ABS2KLR3_9GAMM|nr:protein translocase subunit SecF [Dyella mobilis]MBM7132086.1 protein translocase subunit SecF [Dyella mobilis]GLQ95928.1 protein-export membrane protein SecF [Dyella mobilis]